jgi:hypothetical protein
VVRLLLLDPDADLPQVLDRLGRNPADDLVKLIAEEFQRSVGQFVLLTQQALVDQHGPAFDLPDLVAVSRIVGGRLLGAVCRLVRLLPRQ